MQQELNTHQIQYYMFYNLFKSFCNRGHKAEVKCPDINTQNYIICNLFKSFFNRGHRTEVKQFEDWKGAANAVKAVASVPGGLSGDYKYGEYGESLVMIVYREDWALGNGENNDEDFSSSGTSSK